LVSNRDKRDIQWFLAVYRIVKKHERSINKRQKNTLRRAKGKLPDHIIRTARSVWKKIGEFGDDFEYEAPTQDVLESRYKSFLDLMETLEKDIDEYERNISQYWS